MKKTGVKAFSKCVLENGELIFTLSGEIDHHTAAYLREEMDMEIYRYKPKQMRLDFSKITFMDSAGLGLAVGRYRKVRELGGEVVLALGKNERSLRMFQMAGLERLEGLTLKTEPEAKKGSKQ